MSIKSTRNNAPFGDIFSRSRNQGTNASLIGPTSPTDYPLLTGQYQVFSTDWPGSPANLPVSDSPTTFTVPSAAKGYVRVVVVGGASASAAYGAGDCGNGAYIDALIPVAPGVRFKAIVGGGGGTANCNPGSCNSPDSRGGNGLGGGCGVDSNDSGSGGGGSGFFYAEPGATSDPAMFPFGVLIAGGGGGGGSGGVPAGSNPAGPSPDPIGGFNGIYRGGTPSPSLGEPGQVGGTGGRVRNNSGSLVGSNAARGVGGQRQNEGYPNCNGGTGGGAGAGGYGGDCNEPSPTAAENAPDGRGAGYGSFNDAGAGYGGSYPMRGGNGFSFQGVNLGGGSGGSHGRGHAGGGWGGGGGVYYNQSGGSGGSGAWGYVTGTTTIQGWTPSSSITVNGGTVNSVMSVPTSLGQGSGNPGYIVVMW